MSANPFAPVLRSLRKRLDLDPTTDGLLLERFAIGQDEAAFAALVERHADLVWGVCRRVARDNHAAEDAFQATWLVLARKAASLRNGAALPGWLHRVAFRLTLAARAKLVARTLPDTAAPTAGPEEEATRSETLAALDEEVGRLPEKYRLPVLLCYFQGRSLADAAAELGVPEGTVASRLARARDLLHARLSRRGVEPAVPLLGGTIAGQTVAPTLVQGAVSAAVAFAKGEAVSGAAARLALGMLAKPFPGWGALVSFLLMLGAIAAGWSLGGAAEEKEPETGPSVSIPVPEDIGKGPRTPIPARAGELSFALSPDGKTLAFVEQKVVRDRDGVADYSRYDIRLWDIHTAAVRAALTIGSGRDPIHRLAFGTEAHTLLASSANGVVTAWDLRTGKHRALAPGRDTHGGCPVWFSWNGEKLAQADDTGRIRVWDGETGNDVAMLKVLPYPDRVPYAEFSPDSATLVSCGSNGDVTFWDVQTGQARITHKGEGFPIGYPEGVPHVWFSPDGKYAVARSRETEVWDGRTGKVVRTLPKLSGYSGASDGFRGFSPDGRLVARYEMGTLTLIDLETGQKRATLKSDKDAGVYQVAFFPGGRTVLVHVADVASGDRFRLWEATTGGSP
jgi:RNA polymerase sigma factor (sigma-70 family)